MRIEALLDEPGWRADPDIQPPFEVIEPPRLAAPLVFDSPHSGSRYPSAFLAASRLDPLTLRRSEDAFVDELFLPCVALGAPLLRARFPRAFLDLNREPFELDPRMFDGPLPDYVNTRSLRVAAGLGTIPRVVGDAQPIYRGRVSVADALARVAALHRPYHQRLAGLIERTRARFGVAILVDCHSMPSTLAEAGSLDIVLGDRFGASAAPWVVEALESALLARGYRVRRNKPYAGGYITEHYGAPAAGRHAVQIEVNRALYMDEARMVKLERAAELAESLKAAAESVGGARARRTGGRALGGGVRGRSAPADMRGPHKGRRIKRRPPCRHGGLSLGRKRPRRAYAAGHAAPQQYVRASQQRQAFSAADRRVSGWCGNSATHIPTPQIWALSIISYDTMACARRRLRQGRNPQTLGMTGMQVTQNSFGLLGRSA